MDEKGYVLWDNDTDVYLFCDKDTNEVCIITNDDQLKERAKIIYKFFMEKGIDFTHDKNSDYNKFKDKVLVCQ